MVANRTLEPRRGFSKRLSNQGSGWVTHRLTYDLQIPNRTEPPPGTPVPVSSRSLTLGGPRSCRSIDLNRKGLIDDDGVSLAGMLEKNQGGRGGSIGRPEAPVRTVQRRVLKRVVQGLVWGRLVC